MKEATGELNMTVITVVAIAAIGGLFYAFVWPMIQAGIRQRTCDTFGTDYVYDSDQDACCGTSPTTGRELCYPVSDNK